MLKNILAVVAGLAVAFITIMALQMIGYAIHPFDMDMSWTEDELKAAMAEHIKNAPFAAMLTVSLGYIVAAFAGAWVCAKIAVSNQKNLAIVVGVVLLLLTIMNYVQYPSHPIWMWILAALIVPAAYYGWKVSGMQNDRKKVESNSNILDA